MHNTAYDGQLKNGKTLLIEKPVFCNAKLACML